MSKDTKLPEVEKANKNVSNEAALRTLKALEGFLKRLKELLS